MKRSLFALIVVALLLSACSDARPTHTPLIHAANVPTLQAQDEAATAIAPVENVAPVIAHPGDQTTTDGESFKVILGDYVTDANDAVTRITWSHSGNVDLEVHITGQAAAVAAPDARWSGSETIHFEACDPGGLCDATDITFTVTPENDAPVVFGVDDQMIFAGETFAEITLDDYVSDEDNSSDEMTWSCAGNVDLELNITDRVATVSVPDAAWSGSEEIRFEACDPGGLCDASETVFEVLDESAVVITFVSNAGFLIASGEKKVLVDALFQIDDPEMPPAYARELMENALPPFDDVDLILVTHPHGDHFDPSMVGSHLENNPQAIFVSTQEVVNRLQAGFSGFDEAQERIRGFFLKKGASAQLSLDGIELEIIDLPHAGNSPFPNLGFIFNVGDVKLFHMGDAGEDVTLSYIQAYQLPSKEIDVVFVPSFFLMEIGDVRAITEGVQAKQTAVVQIFPGNTDTFNTIRNYWPDAVLFYYEMEKWVISP